MDVSSYYEVLERVGEIAGLGEEEFRGMGMPEIDKVLQAVFLEYLGIDPNKKALDLVREDINTRCCIIEGVNGQDHMLYWDWVIASGVFNIGLKEQHTYWTIQNMIQHAKKGVVFNMLTYPYPDEQYEAYVPEEVKSKLMDMSYSYKQIKIVEDYMPEEVSDAEFTVSFYV